MFKFTINLNKIRHISWKEDFDEKTHAILRTGIICAFHKLPLPAGEGWGGGSKSADCDSWQYAEVRISLHVIYCFGNQGVQVFDVINP
jgi:hypothetical protein